jgi:hypothetical protein
VDAIAGLGLGRDLDVLGVVPGVRRVGPAVRRRGRDVGDDRVDAGVGVVDEVEQLPDLGCPSDRGRDVARLQVVGPDHQEDDPRAVAGDPLAHDGQQIRRLVADAAAVLAVAPAGGAVGERADEVHLIAGARQAH